MLRFIFEAGGNILDSSQHNDIETDTFFLRVEWDTTTLVFPRQAVSPGLCPGCFRSPGEYVFLLLHNLAGDVFVENARDQRLIGNSLFKGLRLQSFHVAF